MYVIDREAEGQGFREMLEKGVRKKDRE